MRTASHVLILGILATALAPIGASLSLALAEGTAGDGGTPDVEKELEELRRTLDGSGGGSNAPVQPGPGDDGVIDVAPKVGSVLAENWAVTGIITIGVAAVILVGWVLASRYIDPKEALANPQRSMLYGFVKGNPGVHLKQLSHEFRMKTSTVLWHVRKLEAADLVRSKKANGYRVFYPVSGGMEARQLSEAVTALSNLNARQIFETIEATPGVQPRGLSGTLGINSGTVRWHLKKLRDSGLVQELGQGRLVSYFPTDLGQKARRQVVGIAPAPVTATITSTTPTTVLEDERIAG